MGKTLIIDAKLIPIWERSIFAEYRDAGVGAVNLVCSIWETFDESLTRMNELRDFVNANSDLVFLVDTVDNLESAHAKGRLGLIATWQNSDGFGPNLDSVETFRRLGLRVAQPTFISANRFGSGCMAEPDTGLTPLGGELVEALNTAGIAIDLALVGSKTAQDILAVSSRPSFYSQASPYALNRSTRNKTDEEMRAVTEGGGIVCLTTLRHYLPSGMDSTVEDVANTVLYVRNVVGGDCIGIGSDLTPGQPPEFLDYVSREGGNGRKLTNYSHTPVTPGFEDATGYQNLADALGRKGMRSSQIARLMGGNIRDYFSRAWINE